MSETFLYNVDIWSNVGFLGSRAPLYIDIVVSFFSLLPFLLLFSILLAGNNSLKLHKVMQVLLFLFTLLGLSLFAYGVYFQEEYTLLVKQSSIPSNQILYFLIFHILVVVVMMSKWLFAILYALSDMKRRALPGVYSEGHRRSGKRIFFGIFLISLTLVGIYWMLFVA